MPVTEKTAAKLAKLPDSPGVYQLKDARGKILYIGKALNLKNRVMTYFQDSARHDPRIARLVTKIGDLDWIVVPTELDALTLESSLIRQFKPHYNTMLKDDKSYPYIKITVNEPFPRVMLTRRYLNDKARYWGPLASVTQVRRAVRFIANLFTLRTCKLELDGETFMQKPCLDYHLKLCSAPCAKYIKREDYLKLVGYAVDFFNGNYGRVRDELNARMWEASEAKQYENAARYRDLLGAVDKSFGRTRVMGKPAENLDVIGLARSKDRACVLIMPMRDGRLLGDRKYILDHRLEDSAENDVLAGFIKLHYANPQNVPPELVLPHEPQEAELLREWLMRLRFIAEKDIEHLGLPQEKKKPGVEAKPSFAHDDKTAKEGQSTASPLPRKPADEGDREPGESPRQDEEENSADVPPATRKVVFTYPQRGHKRELLELAIRNAEERLHTVLLGDDADYVVTPGQRALAEHLGLAEVPRRVEGYDIANIQGRQATGAMVVFVGGRKAAQEYRLFNIRLKDTPDDYAMLRETLGRRLRRLLTDPNWHREVDVIMIDGGKGQLNCVRQVFEGLLASPDFSAEQREKLEAIKLCSLAKQEETIYHYGDDDAIVELKLPHTDEGLRLLVALRDEAHRYGNAQHQRLRDKAMKLGVLDTIPGLGPAKQSALLNHFGSGKRVREATVEELCAVKGIARHLAEHIRRYLDRDAELEEAKAGLKREMRIRRVRRSLDEREREED
ncbi:excinuclease ABC subunit C [bacterium]|nr:excinuclease ABC subunit C [bacterium]